MKAVTNMLAGIVLLIGATFFACFLLEQLYPSSLAIFGIPFLTIGGLGLATFFLGFGEMLVRAAVLFAFIKRTPSANISMVSPLLRSVFKVGFGLIVLMLYIYFAKAR